MIQKNTDVCKNKGNVPSVAQVLLSVYAHELPSDVLAEILRFLPTFLLGG